MLVVLGTWVPFFFLLGLFAQHCFQTGNFITSHLAIEYKKIIIININNIRNIKELCINLRRCKIVISRLDVIECTVCQPMTSIGYNIELLKW